MLEKILLMHARRYPLMEPQDAVKLIYQNEFGVGHLIADPGEFRKRLESECSGAIPRPDIPLTETIGNGLVRVMLNSPRNSSLDMRRLTEACLMTAAGHRGTLESFLEKLSLLREVCGKRFFGFSAGQLDSFLVNYAEKGYPMVSHSTIYRNTYYPAYRVAALDCCREKGFDFPSS